MAEHFDHLRNVEAEQAVLGALLADHMTVFDVRPIVSAEDFWWEPHGLLYKTILSVMDSGADPDIVTVSDELERTGAINEISYKADKGMAYLSKLPSLAPFIHHVTHYAKIVHDYALRRALLRAAGRIAKEASDAESANDALIDSLAALENVRQGQEDSLRSSKALIEDFTVTLTDFLQASRNTWGFSTGFPDLDRLTGGLERGEYTILAARPSMGKSALALQIARHIAEKGVGVAFFSLEMGQSQLMLRMACSGAMVDSYRVRRGTLDDPERTRLWEDVSRIHDLPIWWLYKAGLTVEEATALVAKLRLRQDVGLMVFDYIQLANSSGENQNIRIGRISQGLKQIAMRFNVCVLAVSQLSRAVERRGTAPKLSDLRDSGSLEQDADKILFIHREDGSITDTTGNTQVILAKNRNGLARVTISDLLFWETYAKFVSKSNEKEPDGRDAVYLR